MENPIIDEAGNKFWYQNDQLHRIHGPAIERANGEKEWWVNGKRHRLDGPACEFPDGFYWYIDGENYTEEQFSKVKVIDGNVYILICKAS